MLWVILFQLDGSNVLETPTKWYPSIPVLTRWIQIQYLNIDYIFINRFQKNWNQFSSHDIIIKHYWYEFYNLIFINILQNNIVLSKFVWLERVCEEIGAKNNSLKCKVPCYFITW